MTENHKLWCIIVRMFSIKHKKPQAIQFNRCIRCGAVQ